MTDPGAATDPQAATGPETDGTAARRPPDIGNRTSTRARATDQTAHTLT
ncbi:hypothetical protein GCM10010368_62980 [Streptomyces roseiscleroticus]|uniref:Uncharacterized protein n=1 Tax=Streptomyces roseiscleroticus TaxID=1972 RepID=A0ABP5S366_9ACTN